MDPALESYWDSQSAFLITNVLRVVDQYLASSVFMVDLVGKNCFFLQVLKVCFILNNLVVTPAMSGHIMLHRVRNSGVTSVLRIFD